MKKRKKSKKNILALSILTTITVFAWIGFDVYRALYKSYIPEILQEQLQPLDPNFDKKTLESLKKRKPISEKELGNVPEITVFELSTEEATPEIKVASPGGEIE